MRHFAVATQTGYLGPMTEAEATAKAASLRTAGTFASARRIDTRLVEPTAYNRLPLIEVTDGIDKTVRVRADGEDYVAFVKALNS
jgi:hypothetical protein